MVLTIAPTEDCKQSPAPAGALVFAEEFFPDAWPEFMRLAVRHWCETEMYRAGEGMNPDEERYTNFNHHGMYRFFSVRSKGRMVGYCGMYVMRSMHTQKTVATEDAWFLLPEFRKGRNAIRFYQYVERQMKDAGAQRITMSTKITNKAGRILTYLGYSHFANQYTKEL